MHHPIGRRTRRSFLASFGIVTAGCVAPTPNRDGHSEAEARTTNALEANWPMVSNDAGNTGYTPEAIGLSDAPTEAWRATGAIEHGDVLSSPVVADGVVYVGCGHTFYALDLDDGDERWTRQFDGEAGILSPAVTEDIVLAVDAGEDGDSIRALETDDGSPRWTRDVGVSSAITVTDDASYWIDARADSTLARAVDMEGNHLWTRTLAEGTESERLTAAPAIDGGVAYVVAQKGTQDAMRLFAIDSEDGSEHWYYDVDQRPTWSSPAVSSGVVYIGDGAGRVHAIDVTDGTQRWSFQATQSIRSSPAIGTDTVFVADFGGELYALDIADGTERWRTSTGTLYTDPAIGGDTIYTSGTNVMAIDVDDGSTKWEFELPEFSSREFAPVAVVDERIVFASCVKEHSGQYRYDNYVHTLH